MGEKRKKLCRVLAAFMLCYAAAAAARIFDLSPALREREGEETPFFVYIDPGHGGFDLGAVGQGTEGLTEKELVLQVAVACGQELQERGYRTLFSRTGDERLTYTTAGDEVRARRAAAQAAGVDLLLSIHANAYAGTGRAYGARVYYNPASEASRRAATCIAAAITAGVAPFGGRTCRTVADGTYYLLAEPTMPAVLVELGFLSDGQECALLSEAAYRTALAEAICRGVAEAAAG